VLAAWDADVAPSLRELLNTAESIGGEVRRHFVSSRAAQPYMQSGGHSEHVTACTRAYISFLQSGASLAACLQEYTSEATTKLPPPLLCAGSQSQPGGGEGLSGMSSKWLIQCNDLSCVCRHAGMSEETPAKADRGVWPAGGADRD